MLEELKEQVCRANLSLAEEGLVFQSWGNASGCDRRRGLVVIKPSGMPCRDMTPERMVVVSLADGKVAAGDLAPSCDTPTHLVLYRALADVGGIVHTHSLYATAWAQARRSIEPYGTTHADYFHGSVPATRPLRPEETAADYEANTGRVIVETLAGCKAKALDTPGILVAEHGPFAWGATPIEAADNAAVLERIAMLASLTLGIAPDAAPISQALLDRHFLRKHGKSAYYGQRRNQE